MGILAALATSWPGSWAISQEMEGYPLQIAGILNCWFLVHKLLMEWWQHGRLRVRAVVDTLLGCILVLTPYISMQGEAVSSLLHGSQRSGY